MSFKCITKSPLRIILVGLVPLCITCFFLYLRIKQWRDILGNLTTEIAGIIITLFFVDLILKWHEKKQWNPTKKRLHKRLITLANSTITCIRSGLAIPVDDDVVRHLYNENMSGVQDASLKQIEEVVLPVIRQKLDMLDKKGWANLATQIRYQHASLTTFLTHGDRWLSSEQIPILWDLEESLAQSIMFYEVFPETFNNEIPTDLSPELRTLMLESRKTSFAVTAKRLIHMLRLAKKLINTIPNFAFEDFAEASKS